MFFDKVIIIVDMKRILLIGNSPLPTENTKSRPAAGLRTYQFLKPLIQEGGTTIDKAEHAFSSKNRPDFKVTLVTIALPECYDEEPGQKEIGHSDHFRHLSISKNDPNLFPTIQRLHDDFIPDAIIGVNTFGSYVASTLNSHAPLWADLNGWIMAEAQAQASKMESNDYLSHYFEMEETVLKRADKISCVSDPQKYAVLGELATFGRINRETFGYKFTYSIPNGTEIFEGEDVIFDAEKQEETMKKIGEIFNNRFPADAFSLLWMGGYNTWVDEINLFKSVSDAMEKCPKLFFVSTGGEISGLDNKTFSKFKKMIDESKFKDRFLFLGWVKTSDIPFIYARANAGLNIDRKCAETYTGARNRINEMMKFGVPVITTLGSEISYEVPVAGAGVAVKSGKHELVTEEILHMYHDWNNRHGYKLKEYGENGRKYIKEKCNYEYLLKPLLKWLENPRPAPDRGIVVKIGGKFGYTSVLAKARGAFTYLKNSGLKKFLGKLWQQTIKLATKIKNSGSGSRQN